MLFIIIEFRSSNSDRRKTYGIKVGHLPPTISYKQIREHFHEFGGIADIFVKRGTGGCYAFVNFYSNFCAQKAANAMDGTIFEGRTIACKVQIEPRITHVQKSNSVATEMYTVKVTHLAKSTSEYSLLNEFRLKTEENDIHNVRIIQCSKVNHAYVNYLSLRDAQNAVTIFDQRYFDGSKIRVKLQIGQVSQPSLKVPGEPMYTIPQTTTTLSQLSSPQPSCHSLNKRRSPSHPKSASIPGPKKQNMLARPKSSIATPVPMAHSQSCTVKVSMYSKLKPEDIKTAFGQFGPIQNRVYIRGRDPSYTFVTFSSPEVAANACKLHNTTVKHVKVCVKVHIPDKQASPNLYSKEIQYSPLTASILKTKHKAELERLEKEHQVKIVMKPTSSCIKISGEEEQVIQMELCLQLLEGSINSRISTKDCELPCHSAPLFEQDSTIKKIASNHGVQFCVSRNSTFVEVTLFCKEVKQCFSPTPGEGLLPTCSALASYLKEKTEFTWLWEDDYGGYTPYSSKVSFQLSRGFYLSPSGKFAMTRGSVKYLINFSEMTQTNITTRHSRSIKKMVGMIQWLWHDGMTFVPYTQTESVQIEQMFHSKICQQLLSIEGNMYTFDFTTMTQCNLHSNYKRKIERRVEDAIPKTEHVLTLKVSGLPESLEPAMKELKETVEKATVEKECLLNMESSNGFKARLVKNMNKYFVTADLVDDCLKLKGMPRYVERVHLLAEQEKISDREQQIRDSMGGVELKLPSHWKPQSQDVYLDRVRHDSNEWKEEVKRIRNTLGGVSIVKLERIQNKWLWERYSFAKKQMSKKNKGQVNEIHLFHGTRKTSPEKVFRSEKGVDFRYSKEGLWGTGSYFAVNASYSNNYAYTIEDGSTEKQMFICKVLTGDHYNAESKTDQTLRQPPPKPIQTHGSFEEERYDSVKGYTNGSCVYVVYDHEKMYPAYLVTYKQVEHVLDSL